MDIQSDTFYSRKRQIQIGALSSVIIVLCFLLFFSPFRITKLINNNVSYKAYFDNIGELKVNSPVKLSGVTLGQVLDIKLDKDSLLAEVTFNIDKEYISLISPSSVINIQSPLFLGETFISIEAVPGYKGKGPKNGCIFVKTNSASSLQEILNRVFEVGLEFYKDYNNNHKGTKD